MFLSAYSTFYQLFLGVSALVVLGNMVLLGVRFLRRGSAPQAKDLSDRDIARWVQTLDTPAGALVQVLMMVQKL